MTHPKSTVALIACDSYDEDAVYRALKHGLALLGGPHRFAASGESLLLKPNVLTGAAPERCVSTHPSVVKAAARLFREITPHLSCGDSPGSGLPESQLRSAGIGAAMEEAGIRPADFDRGEERTLQNGESVLIALGALAADGLINLCKLKTHGYTRMTGAVKNLYGCIPGTRKKAYHFRHPDAFGFSRLLVRLNLLLEPRLHIMDGIMAMQGNGPGGGDPFPLGVLLVSSDPVALDSVMCRLVELDPGLVPSNGAGRTLGLGTFRADEVEIVGEPLDRVRNGDFDVRRGPLWDFSRQGLLAWVNNLLGERPVIDEKRCTRCGECVRACPAEPAALSWGRSGRPPQYHYMHCIRCYCCQEICPEGAISIRTSALALP